MIFEVLFDDGHQSIPVEQYEILGDAIACYVNCIRNAKNDMNALKLSMNILKQLPLTLLQIPSAMGNINPTKCQAKY